MRHQIDTKFLEAEITISGLLLKCDTELCAPVSTRRVNCRSHFSSGILERNPLAEASHVRRTRYCLARINATFTIGKKEEKYMASVDKRIKDCSTCYLFDKIPTKLPIFFYYLSVVIILFRHLSHWNIFLFFFFFLHYVMHYSNFAQYRAELIFYVLIETQDASRQKIRKVRQREHLSFSQAIKLSPISEGCNSYFYLSS